MPGSWRASEREGVRGSGEEWVVGTRGGGGAALLTSQANIIINDKDRKQQQVNDIFSQDQLSRQWNSSWKTEEKLEQIRAL